MEVGNIPQIAQHFLQQYGLLAWRFEWDRARVRAGACKHGRKVISLSRHYVELNIAKNFDDVVDTILHEIAHALVGPRHGHDDVWKAACCRVGAKPQRCYDADVVVMSEGRVVALCGGCGKVFRRHKMLRAGTWRYCRKCGPVAGRLVYMDEVGLAKSFPLITDPKPSSNPKRLR